MPHQTPEETIAERMEQPKKGVNNMGEFEEHSLSEQIKAAKFLAANDPTAIAKFKGMMINSFGMPGTM